MRLADVDSNEVLSCMVLLNWEDGIRGNEEDVELKEGYMLWMEISETPQQLRNKLVQLERVFLHFKHIDRENYLPQVAVICLNGEKGLFC